MSRRGVARLLGIVAILFAVAGVVTAYTGPGGLFLVFEIPAFVLAAVALFLMRDLWRNRKL
jgi:hypothetical protein